MDIHVELRYDGFNSVQQIGYTSEGARKRKELGSALFSGGDPPIVAAAELNFRVRDGAGCSLRAIAAELFPVLRLPPFENRISVHALPDRRIA